jgi:hypothetical protein
MLYLQKLLLIIKKKKTILITIAMRTKTGINTWEVANCTFGHVHDEIAAFLAL